ncbi:MAG: hypothetical protein MJ252_19675, partial [archaeon]|nr:hypothetical protein [archaeon]
MSDNPTPRGNCELISPFDSDEKKAYFKNSFGFECISNSLQKYYTNEENKNFFKKADKLAHLFLSIIDKYLLQVKSLEITKDSIFDNLFTQIKIYSQEIERLNSKILILSQSKKNKDTSWTKENFNKEISKQKAYIKNLESKLEQKVKSENLLKKEIEIYKNQISFYKVSLNKELKDKKEMKKRNSIHFLNEKLENIAKNKNINSPEQMTENLVTSTSILSPNNKSVSNNSDRIYTVSNKKKVNRKSSIDKKFNKYFHLNDTSKESITSPSKSKTNKKRTHSIDVKEIKKTEPIITDFSDLCKNKKAKRSIDLIKINKAGSDKITTSKGKTKNKSMSADKKSKTQSDVGNKKENKSGIKEEKKEVNKEIVKTDD